MITKPSPLTRLKAAVQFYRHGFRSLSQPGESKKFPFTWPAWFTNRPQWQLVDYKTYAEQGFNVNPILFAALMYKARALTVTPLRAYTGTPEEPELLPRDNPLQALCRRPNPFQSGPEFLALANVCFNLAGNCYIIFERKGDQVVGMYVARPDRIFIIPSPNRKELIGFWYVPEGAAWPDGRAYLPQEVMHVKNPNPTDPLDGLGYGISSVSPSAHAINVDNDLTKFFHLFFRNGAMPQGLLSFDVPMQDDDVSRARERWNEIYGGYENWAEESVAVLDQGGKYQRVGFTFPEMDVSNIDARNESRIVGPLGVPLNLIESRPQLVQSTYSNKETDRLMFWEDTMGPELLWFESEFQYYLGDGNQFVMFDMTRSPAARKERLERMDRFEKAFTAKAITIDEYRTALDPQLGPAPEELKNPPIPAPLQDFANGSGMSDAEEQAEEDGQPLKHILAIISDANRRARLNRASLNWDSVLSEVSDKRVRGVINQAVKDGWSVPTVQSQIERLYERQ